MPRKAPNFIFILADDLGYADLGCYGARAGAETPRLDELAAGGVRFSDGYANSALCSPSRFALITGRYQYRLRGAAEEPLPASARGSEELGLPASHPTLPSLLRAAGYDTALIGKWHLGYPPHFGPRKSGYDEFFGSIGGAIDYFSHVDGTGKRDLYTNESESHETGYFTDLISDHAARYVERRQGNQRPFLLSVHYTAPHWPWETRDDEAESTRIGSAIYHIDGGSVRTYQRMVSHMDEGIGRLLDTLAAEGLADDTFVVFTSDNGGERYSDSWPFVGVKMDLLEGGIRVPLIARWPAAIAPGTTTSQVAVSMDWMPTFLRAAEIDPHPDYPPDGVDLLPLLHEPQERELYWRMNYRSQRAARIGNWKYLSMDGNEYLFDLAVSPRERGNLGHRFPEKLATMRDRFEAWSSSMPAIPASAYVGRRLTDAEMARSTI